MKTPQEAFSLSFEPMLFHAILLLRLLLIIDLFCLCQASLGIAKVVCTEQKAIWNSFDKRSYHEKELDDELWMESQQARMCLTNTTRNSSSESVSLSAPWKDQQPPPFIKQYLPSYWIQTSHLCWWAGQAFELRLVLVLGAVIDPPLGVEVPQVE